MQRANLRVLRSFAEVKSALHEPLADLLGLKSTNGAAPFEEFEPDEHNSRIDLIP